MSPRFVSPGEVAKLLSLDTRAIYKAIQDGELKAYRFRGRFRIAMSDLENYIEKAKV
jgi:excisionase family DNA binding protein